MHYLRLYSTKSIPILLAAFVAVSAKANQENPDQIVQSSDTVLLAEICSRNDFIRKLSAEAEEDEHSVGDYDVENEREWISP